MIKPSSAPLLLIIVIIMIRIGFEVLRDCLFGRVWVGRRWRGLPNSVDVEGHGLVEILGWIGGKQHREGEDQDGESVHGVLLEKVEKRDNRGHEEAHAAV